MMKIVLQLTSADGDVELVTIVAEERFTVPAGVTVEIVSLEGVSDLRVESGELVLSGAGGTIRIAGLGADFLAETASIDGIGIDGPLPAGFARYFGWMETQDRGEGRGDGFGDAGDFGSYSSDDDRLPPSLGSSHDNPTPAPEAPSILSFTDDTGVPGDGITADNTITLTGIAEAGASVTIFDGDMEIGTATSDIHGNWTFSTAMLADGPHSFTATAANLGGTGEASPPLSVTVDTRAPDITIVAPISGDGFVNAAEDASLSISGTAEGGHMVFVTLRDANGATFTANAGIDVGGAWTVADIDVSDLENGTVTVEAFAVDVAGNQSETVTATFELDNTVPDVPVVAGYADDTGISGDGITSDSTPTLSGTAEANAEIAIYNGATLLGTTIADGDGNWSFTAPELADGPVNLVSTARDAAGNVSNPSAALDLAIDTIAPGISIDTPISGDGVVNALEDTSLSVSGTAEGGHTVIVAFRDAIGATVTANADVAGNGDWTVTDIDISGLEYGTISVEVFAVDEAGNRSDTISETIELENVAPDAPLITTFAEDTGAEGDRLTADNTPTLMGTAEAGATVEIFDGGTSLGTVTADGNGDWLFTAPELADGVHSLAATARDAAGNVSDSSATLEIVVDTEAPGISITTPISGDNLVNASEGIALSVAGTAVGGQRVYLTLTDSNGTQVTGTAFVDSDGNWQAQHIDVSTLDGGPVVIEVSAEDASGNRSEIATADFVYDGDAPSAPVITGYSEDSGTPDDFRTNDNTPTLTGTAEAGVTVEIFAGSTSLGTTTVDGNGSWTFTTPELTDGSYTFTARAEDAAGNASGSSGSLNLAMDTVPPGITITTPISGDGFVNAGEDTTLSISGTSPGGQRVFVTLTDEGGATVTGQASVSGGGAWLLPGIDISGLQNGAVTIEAYAVDQAGNRSETVGETVVFDSEIPVAPVIVSFSDDTGVPGDSRTNDTTPTLVGTAEANATVEIRNGASLLGTAEVDGNGNWSFTTGALAEGVHGLSVRVVDEAGNRGPAASLTLVIDTTPPGITLTTPISGDGVVNAAEDGILSVSGTAPGGQRVFLTFTDESGAFVTAQAAVTGGAAWTATGIDVSALRNGQIAVEAYAVDQAGNQSGAISTFVTLDNVTPTTPVIAGFSEDTGIPGDRQTSDNTLTFTGTAEANATVNVYLGGGIVATGLADAAGNWSATTGILADGYSSFTARAVDAAGNQSGSSDAYVVIVDTVAPAAPAIAGYSTDTGAVDDITSDSNLTLTGTAAAGTSRIVVYDNGVEIGTVVPVGGNWSFATGVLADGDHSFTVAARDAVGNESSETDTLDITIDTAAPDAPVITGFSQDTGTVGDGVTADTTLTINGTAEEGSEVRIYDHDALLGVSMADGDGNWSFDTGVLTQTEHSFTARAADVAGNVSDSSEALNVTVSIPVTPVPVITGFGQDTGTIGDLRTSDTSLTLSGTSAADATVEIFRDGVSLGTALANDSGTWTFETGEIGEGVHTFTAVATAPWSNQSPHSVALSVTVDTTAPTVTIASPVDGDNLIGLSGASAVTVSGTATEGQFVEVTFRDGLNATVTGSVIIDGTGHWTLASVDISALAEGAIDVEAYTTDAAGNRSLTATHQFVLDKTPPAAPVITGWSEDTGVADGTTSDTTLTFTGTADADATVQIFRGGGLVATTTADGDGNWSVTTGELSQGYSTFEARAIDAAGNRSGWSGSVAIGIDTTPPAMPMISGFSNDSGAQGDGITSDNTPTLVGTGDAGSTVVIFSGGVEIGTAYVFGGGAWTFTTGVLGNGDYSFTAIARDGAGNESGETEALHLSIDASAPAAPVITGFSDDTGAADNQTADNTLTFTGTAEANATVNVYVGVSVVATGVADGDGNWTASTGVMPDGWTNFYARAFDTAGNQSGSSSTLTVNIDTTPPAAPAITGFTNDNGTAPDDGISSFNWTQLSGTASAGTTRVVVYNGGIEAGTAFVTGGSWSLLISALPQGTHEFTAVGFDYVGNASGESNTVRFTADLTPPGVPAITGLSDDTGTEGDFRTADATPTLSGTAEANATVTIRDGSTVLGTALVDGDGNWSFDTGPLTEGAHNFTVKATDLAGRDSTWSGSQIVVVDTTPPAAPVITGYSDDSLPIGDGHTNDTTPVLAGTAEANSVVEIFANDVSLGTTTASVGGAWSFATEELPEASYIFTAQARDSAGNVSAPSAPLNVVISSAPPPATETPVILSFANDSGVANDGVTNDTTLLISGTAVAFAAIEIFDGALSLGTTTANAAGNWSYTTAPLSDGDHEFTAIATAPGGYPASEPSAALHVVVDTAAPSTPVITGWSDDTGAADGTTRDNELSFTGTSEANATINLYRNGSLIATTVADGGGNWTVDTGVVADGYATYTARAFDAAGNASAHSDGATIIVDTTPPAVPVITGFASDTGTPGDGITGNTTLVISGTATADASEIVIYDHGVEIGIGYKTGATTWSFSTPILGPGAHEFTAAARDSVGNLGVESAPLSVTIDTTPPAAPVITSMSEDTGSSPSDNNTSDNTPTLSGTAEADAVVRIYRGGGYVGETVADGDGNWSFTMDALIDGYHFITARQLDAAGNQSNASATWAVQVDTVTPTVTITTPIAGDNIVNGSEQNYFNVSGTAPGGAQTVYIDFTDSLGATVSRTAIVSGTSWTLSGANIAGMANGEITISAYAVDGAGNQSSAVTRTVILDSAPPATPVIAGFTDDTGFTANHTSDTTPTLTGTAEAGSEIRVYLGASLVGTTTADGDGHWTATTSVLPEGYHYLTARAVDEAGNLSGSSNIQVVWVDTTPPPAPTIDNWSDDNGTPGDGVTEDNTITLSGTRIAGTVVAVYNDGVLLGTVPMTGTTWTFTTDALPDGDHSFTVTAIDGAGNESGHSAATAITVQAEPPVPAADDMIGSVPDGWTVFADNGHAYNLVGSQNYWTDARDVAADALPGESYLLTITNAEENAFATTIYSGRLWLGATDVASEGNWVWQTGPEAGTAFWSGDSSGSAVGGAYSNWASGQPSVVDGNGSDEDYLIRNSSAQWNDSLIYDTFFSARVIAEIGGNGRSYAEDVNEDAPYTFSANVLLQNDGDGAVISSVSATSSLGASLTYNAGTGEITYDPTAAGSIQTLNAGQTATDSFTYTLAGGSTATVSIEVAGRDEISGFSMMSMSFVPDAASLLDMSGEIPGLDGGEQAGADGYEDPAAFSFFDTGTQQLFVQDPASDTGTLPAVA